MDTAPEQETRWSALAGARYGNAYLRSCSVLFCPRNPADRPRARPANNPPVATRAQASARAPIREISLSTASTAATMLEKRSFGVLSRLTSQRSPRAARCKIKTSLALPGRRNAGGSAQGSSAERVAGSAGGSLESFLDSRTRPPKAATHCDAPRDHQPKYLIRANIFSSGCSTRLCRVLPALQCGLIRALHGAERFVAAPAVGMSLERARAIGLFDFGECGAGFEPEGLPD